MVEKITSQSIVNKYLKVQQALRSGGLNIDTLLDYAKKGDFPLIKDDTSIPVVFDSPSQEIFMAKTSEDPAEQIILSEEVNNCLIYLSDNLPEELLPKVLMIFSAIGGKDLRTANHSARVCIYSAKLGEACGLNKDEMLALIIGALLHDIGKLNLPDYLFRNDKELTPSELKLIKFHPEDGETILKEHNISNLPGLLIPVRSHHENINGTGYPDGLMGSKIPLLARIVKLADCLDAKLDDRGYRETLTLDTALEQIYAARGREFDPDLVSVLEKLINEATIEVKS